MAQNNEENNNRVGLEQIENCLERNFFRILLGIFFSIFLIPFFLTLPILPEWLAYGKPSEVGDTFGGVMAPFIGLFTIFLIFLTYRTQRRELRATQVTARQQADIMAQQQFENTFFELLKVHRENTEKIREYGGREEFGRRAFAIFKEELEDIYKKLYYNSLNEQDYNANLRGAGYPTTPLQNNNLTEYQRIIISYLIFYYGVERGSIPGLIQALNREGLNIAPNRYQDIIEFFQGCQLLYNQQPQDLNTLHERGFYFQYLGQQANLSHYFRHLFQIIRFIVEHSYFKTLTEPFEEKRKYAKTLRAQMSYHELAIFFPNSITYLGCAWEWQFREKNPECEANKSYITDFELLKNLPENSIILIDDNGNFNPVDHKQYYPGIWYEDESSEDFQERIEHLEDDEDCLNPLSIARSPKRVGTNA